MRRRTLATALLATALATSPAVLAPPAAYADGSPGQLDPTFGAAGMSAPLPHEAFAWDLALQGKRPVSLGRDRPGEGSAQRLILRRFTAGGALDPTFAGGAALRRALRAIGFTSLVGLSTAPDGGFVAVGSAVTSKPGWAMLVVRLRNDGSLKRSFGNGKGYVLTRFGTATHGGTGWSAVRVLPSGKILACGQRVGTSAATMAVARYRPSGALDGSFSGDGKATVGFAAPHDVGCDSLALSGRRVVLSGTIGADTRPYTQTTGALARLRADGRLDTTFGDRGRVVIDLSPRTSLGSVVATDGEAVVVSGRAADDQLPIAAGELFLRRYDAAGQLDATFGDAGTLVLPTPTDRVPEVAGVAAAPDGRLVAWTGPATPGSSTYPLLYRVDATGSLDGGFGVGGVVSTDELPGVHRLALARVMPDLRIVAIGVVDDPVEAGESLAVLRLLG
ncbi:MAG: hypothetical protein R2731_12245 [Nocardioides sp.]